jgi:hypothetical protein
MASENLLADGAFGMPISSHQTGFQRITRLGQKDLSALEIHGVDEHP